MKDIILILILQLFYVPMLTLRTISMVKNLTLLTSIFGFLESLIYVFGLAIVLSGEQSLIEMLVYALGFGLGLAVGIYIEKKLAIGFTTVVVNINHKNEEMINFLRSQGFGVTVINGEGKDSDRFRLDILAKRNREVELMNWIDKFEPNAFVIAYEPKRFKGGYLTDVMKKNYKRGIKQNKHVNLNIEDQESLTIPQKTIKGITSEWRELLRIKKK